MKVLLKQDVANLGYAGEVMDVADGYGRNYLIPQGLAVKATAGVLKEASTWRERAAARMAELRQEHEALANRIGALHLTFIARAGDRGKLYGSITSQDITDRLNEELGTDVDRRNIVGAPLRQIGQHQITVRLSRDYQPQVTIDIHPEEPVGRPAARAQAAAQAEAELLEAEVESEWAETEMEEVEELELTVEAAPVDDEAAEELELTAEAVAEEASVDHEPDEAAAEEWDELIDEEAEETA